MHRVSNYDPGLEFSLDGLRYILERAKEVLKVEIPILEERFLPDEPVDIKDPHMIIDQYEKKANQLEDHFTRDTALILTGDLVHYGTFYGTEEIKEDPDETIHAMIMKGLELVYKDHDYSGFFEHSLHVMNDQWGPAIVASMLLGNDLQYRIISEELSDYSDVLQDVRPCLVASVFYGVHPRN